MNFKNGPSVQEFQLPEVKHISVKDAFELISNDKVFFIDVREESEFSIEFFDFNNVFFHPMTEILDRLQHIPQDIPIVVVCKEGIRSTKVANVFNRQGYATVANLDGGIEEWKRQGLPNIVENFNAPSCDPNSCGCGCSGCE